MGDGASRQKVGRCTYTYIYIDSFGRAKGLRPAIPPSPFPENDSLRPVCHLFRFWKGLTMSPGVVYALSPSLSLSLTAAVSTSLYLCLLTYRYDNICIQLCRHPCCSSCCCFFYFYFVVKTSSSSSSSSWLCPVCPACSRLEFVPAQRSLGLILVLGKVHKKSAANLQFEFDSHPPQAPAPTQPFCLLYVSPLLGPGTWIELGSGLWSVVSGLGCLPLAPPFLQRLDSQSGGYLGSNFRAFIATFFPPALSVCMSVRLSVWQPVF